MQVKKQQLEPDMEQWTGSKLGKAYDKAVCCHSAYLPYVQSSLGFTCGADDTTLMAKSEEELKNLLIKVKEESEKAGLKLNIQKTKITASGPITSWQLDGETMEPVTDFIFLSSKITADGYCSHEIKRHSWEGKL